MADAASANLQIRRPKSMFILRAMWKKAVIRRKKMQTALHFMFARRLQLLNVSLLMLLLLFSRQQNATPKYSRSCRRNETRTRTTHIIFADAILTSISSSPRRHFERVTYTSSSTHAL